MADYLDHGRRHGPGGSDPIPGGPSPSDYAGLSMFPSQSIAGSANDAVAWDKFSTSNTEVFGTGAFTPVSSTPTNTAGDESLMLLGAGVYIVFGAVAWTAGSVDVAAFLDVPRGETGSFLLRNGTAAQEQLASLVGLGGGATELSNYSYVMASVAPNDYGVVTFNVTNFHGSAQVITNAKLTAVYLPTSQDIANVY